VVCVEAESKGPGEEENDGGANRCGEVAVDVLDAYFSEESGGGGEDSGE
jgi:hypothetical protein